jgi:hypothetical protein
VKDGDWYLGYYDYDNYPGAALTFGRMSSGMYTLSEPDIAFADPEVADANLPGEDGVRMGRDYQRSAVVTFEIGVDGVDKLVDRHWPMRPWSRGARIGDWSDTELVAALFKKNQGPAERVLDGVDMMRQVWRADAIRGKAGRVSWLTHRTAGRTRRLYGRPRKFAVSHSRLADQGYVPVVADFVAIDDRFYDDTEKEASLYDHLFVTLPSRPGRYMPPVGLGSQKSTGIKQLGKTITHPYIEIHGPCKNPKITLGPDLWAVQVNVTIDEGDYVQIDARPWIRTVTHYKDGSSKSVADKLTRASPLLRNMFIPPGYWTASLSYTKSTTRAFAGPRVRIAWRDAFTWW